MVDLFQYLKNKGRALGDDAVQLENDNVDEVEGFEILNVDDNIAPVSSSGVGQDCLPIKRKLSSEEGGRVVIDMVRDLDDYLNRGPELAELSPFTYKAIVSRVRKSVIRKRSSKVVKGGKRAHEFFPFTKGHPLYETHVQRLRGKFSIIEFIGMQIPKNPGPKPSGATNLAAWERKMTKVCNYIEAVYLPWKNPERGFRPYQEVLAELASFKYGSDDVEAQRTDTFINKHILRTIGFALNNKSVTSETKKMIQMVRHEFSRKRGVVMGSGPCGSDKADGCIEREYLEIVRDAQLDEICGGKCISSTDKYLEDLKKRYECLLGDVRCKPSTGLDYDSAPTTATEAEILVSAIKDGDVETESVLNHEGAPSSNFFDKEKFLDGMKDGQIAAAEFMLEKLDKDRDYEQLLMILHGAPGTGKTFLIERLRDMTEIKMRITATSGIAAMSLKGSTIDSFMGKGRGKKRRAKVEVVKKNLGKATLLFIDECSMLGCRKLLELDTTLQKVKHNPAPFGGLDIVLAGDFAQLPPVRQISILDAMVNSTLVYAQPSQLFLTTTALMQRFVKFDLTEFVRSESCPFLTTILTRFRNFNLKGGSISVENIKRIGLLNEGTFSNDPKFIEAPFLVATRREKDAITLSAAKL